MNPIKISLKLEKNENQLLLNTADHFRANDGKNNYKVRPWIFGDYATKSRIHLVTQFGLYKCMLNDCLFATDHEEKWKTHMEQHLKLIDVLKDNNRLTNEIRSEYIKFRECPYCIADLPSNFAVIDHIEEEHRRSIFQCKYCFYRTNEMDNIILHHQSFHDDEKSDILVIDDNRNREYEDKDKEILEQGCDQYVKKFKCGKKIDVFLLFNKK